MEGIRLRPAGSRVAALVLGLVLIVSGFVAPPEAAGASRRTLAGTNIITGSRTATMDVYLPKPVLLPLTAKELDKAIDVEERGRVTGFLLEGHDLDHSDGWPLFGYWSLAFCDSATCVPKRSDAFGTLVASGAVDNEDKPTVVTLPAGSYTLHVVADRSPVEVTLRIPGLDGAARFAPRGPAAGPGYIERTERVPRTPGDLVYAHGESTNFSGTVTIADTAVQVAADASVNYTVGHCWYDAPVPPEPIGVRPGCPGGTNAVQSASVVVVAPLRWTFVGIFTLPSEIFKGIGTWYAAQATVTGVRGLEFAIEIGPDGEGAGSRDSSAEELLKQPVQRDI